MIKIKNEKKYFFRFTLNQRIQHGLLASLVIILALTGLPLKFHEMSWARSIYDIFGGITYAPHIHKAAGTLLLILFIYHLIYISVTIYKGHIVPLKNGDGLSIKGLARLFLALPMIPNLKDLKDIFDLFRYLFFLSKNPPRGDEFTWKEKFDYWAPFWGIVIIGSSGLIMWHKEFFSNFLPGLAINFALIAHSDEALLAALFLFIWHFYNVHFSPTVFPMGTTFLTGYLPEELMVEEHYEYYVKVMKETGLENEILPPHGSHADKPAERSTTA